MVRRKVKIAIIGTGNIGSDLLVKVQRSKIIECGMFTGINPKSANIKRAKKLGIRTSYKSIDAIVENPDCCEIVFDATSAEIHRKNAPILKKLGKFAIDMTPSRVGKMCVPLLNLEECLQEDNINLISCGGQATTPIIKTIVQLHPETSYIEIVSSIASKSAGMGTRNNIDEYTQATRDCIKVFAKVKQAKAIIILNPADPPILMHNTIYAQIDKPNISALRKTISAVADRIKKYVPGYRITLGPVLENNRLTIMNEVIGQGDFLPIYAGNLDIINSAAIIIAEEYAKRKLLNYDYESNKYLPIDWKSYSN